MQRLIRSKIQYKRRKRTNGRNFSKNIFVECMQWKWKKTVKKAYKLEVRY